MSQVHPQRFAIELVRALRERRPPPAVPPAPAAPAASAPAARRRGAPRTGVTLVELSVAVGILTMLSGIAAPGVFRAMRQGAVNDAAAAVKQAAEDAQARAMRAGPEVLAPSTGVWGAGLQERYGVRVNPAGATGPATVEILRGNQVIGTPIRLSEAVDLRAWAGPAPAVVSDTSTLVLMPAPVAWWYDWRTGRPVADPTGSALLSSISFTAATRDYRVASSGGVVERHGLATTVTIYRQTGVVRGQ